MRFLGVVVFLFLSWSVWAQQDSALLSPTWGDIVVQSNGYIGVQKNGKPFSRTGAESGNYVGLVAPWFVGLSDTSIHAMHNIKMDEPQLWSGPIDTFTRLPKDPVEWASVWTVTKSEIEYHKWHFEDEGYEVPESLRNWPAAHNESNVSPYLAPFIDWNSDGVYNPENGDYPIIRGDLAAYFISNDLYGENQLAQAKKLGLEIQGMVYAYNNVASLEGVFFVDQYVINRSKNDYAPFYIGQYVDFQLGSGQNDRLATDVNRNAIMALTEDTSGLTGSGFSHVPSASVVSLSDPIYSSHAFYGDPNRGLPLTSGSALQVVEGNWPDSSAKTKSGNGRDGVGAVTKYIYPGMTDGEEGDWLDETSGDDAGHRTGVLSIKKNNLLSGGFYRHEYAVVLNKSGLSSMLQEQKANITTKLDDVQSFYDANLYVGKLEQRELTFYPNPMKQSGFFYLSEPVEYVELLNLLGEKVVEGKRDENEEKKYKWLCNESIAPGVYLLNASTKGKRFVHKVVLTSD